MTPLPYKPGFGKRGFQLTPPTCRPEQADELGVALCGAARDCRKGEA